MEVFKRLSIRRKQPPDNSSSTSLPSSPGSSSGTPIPPIGSGSHSAGNSSNSIDCSMVDQEPQSPLDGPIPEIRSEAGRASPGAGVTAEVHRSSSNGHSNSSRKSSSSSSSSSKNKVEGMRRGSSDHTLDRPNNQYRTQQYGLDGFVPLPATMESPSGPVRSVNPPPLHQHHQVDPDGKPLNIGQIIAPQLGHVYSASYPYSNPAGLQPFPGASLTLSVPSQGGMVDNRPRSGSSSAHGASVTPPGGPTPISTSPLTSPRTSPGPERRGSSPLPSSATLHGRSSSASPPQQAKSGNVFSHRRFSSTRGEKKTVPPSPLSLPNSNTMSVPEASKSPLSPRNFGNWTRIAFSPRRKSQQLDEVPIPVSPNAAAQQQLPTTMEEDPNQSSSPRRLSLLGFAGFRKPSTRRGSKTLEELEGASSPGTEIPAQAQGTDSPKDKEGLFRSKSSGRPPKGHVKAKSPKGKSEKKSNSDESIDKAFGIYNSVLNTQKKNARVAEDTTVPEFTSRSNGLPRTRSRSGDHIYSKEAFRQSELLVRRPTGKLRQTLLKPFTVLGSSRFSSSKRDQQRLKREEEQQKEQQQKELKLIVQQQELLRQQRGKELQQRVSAHQKSQSQPANVLRGNSGNVLKSPNSPLSPKTLAATVAASAAPARPTSLAFSLDTAVVETRPLTGSNEYLQQKEQQDAQRPQFELHSLRLSSDRSRSSSQRTQQTQTSSDERSSISTGGSSADPQLEFLPEDEKKKDRSHKARQQFSSPQGQLFDLKKVLNFVEPGELPNLTQATSLPLLTDPLGGEDKLGKLPSPNPDQRKSKGSGKRPIRSAPEIKTYFDFIRTGSLFMLIPTISEHWNIYFCKLNMLRLQCFESEDSAVPLYSLLLTEINEVKKEQQRGDSQEGVVSIFSHSILVTKFMVSGIQAKEWIADIEAARMESLRNVCSTALGRVGHTRQTR